MSESVVERAHAKVNLRLRILGRRPDGYHELDTIFQALELHDLLEAERARATRLSIDGDVDAGPVEDNLVLRAAGAFAEATGQASGVSFRLTKCIPAGAGLGGGSSDAAAALRALNRLADEPLDAAALLALGARLGSDVAFFLCGATRAQATGRGEQLTALPPVQTRPVLVVDPGFRIATRDAFAWWDARSPAPGAADANDFEPVVFARFPLLARVRDALLEAGAATAMLSGSGSCVFGMFEPRAPTDAAAVSLRAVAPEARVLHTTTLP
ncbi:MAG TPA: 4-(cytidine 5'-diphospho)-2-C-methyl-D-erythritol kinase [Terriglobales bacterium]|nr:4-(cytidine 5'-diphospho)-2-C-methyl-D-erythritol kinase [Terriglobales bacterium]